jgi:hypothetical protein
MPRIKDVQCGAFSRIEVDYSVKGESRITWEIRGDFVEAFPHSYQLQVNRNWSEPGDWQNVGLPVVNTCYAIDDTQRQFGRTLRVAYRVVLTTSLGTYTSQPAEVLGKLSYRQWLQARAIIRRALLEPKGLESFPGYLLKRKLHGTPCTTCVDPYTGGITKTDCVDCHGTGIIDGYWQATTNTMYDMSPELRESKRDPRGTVNELVAVGKFVALPLMHSRDIWVDKHSDRRYVIHRIRNINEINQVPILAEVELRLCQLDGIEYTIPLEGT